MKTVGVLALQGAFAEHLAMLSRLQNVRAVSVKDRETLKQADGIILPGGESTAMGKLLRETGLFEPLRARIIAGLPVFGTCAGLILLAKKIVGEDTVHLGLMDIEVSRNAYGGQLDSFCGAAVIGEISQETPVKAVFIRAPRIERAGGGVTAYRTGDGTIVAAREKNMFVTAFHPELTDDARVHAFFVNGL